MEEYQTLERKLDVPKNLTHVLKRLISPKETRLLVLIADDTLTTKEIAKTLKSDNLKVSRMLEALYKKGFLDRKKVKNEEAYTSKSFYDIISVHLEENRFEALGFENIHTLRQYYLSTRFAKTEKKIHDGLLKYSSKVIPVEKAITATQHVLPTHQAIEILSNSKLCALTECGCRVTFGNCSKPLDTCLLLDEEAERLVSRGYAKRISLAKAKKVLEIADKAGLVHLTLYMPGHKVYAICSCCPCCCHDLQALLKYGKEIFVAKADYVATCNITLCNGCRVCIRRCVFGARKMHNEKSIVDAEKCYGCGLCITSCPTNASKLVARVPQSR